MRYAIEFKPSAARELAKLPRPVQVKIAYKIEALSGEPYPAGVEKLKGAATLFRLRIGDYRVIYSVEKGRLVILVVRIGHRREVYRF